MTMRPYILLVQLLPPLLLLLQAWPSSCYRVDEYHACGWGVNSKNLTFAAYSGVAYTQPEACETSSMGETKQDYPDIPTDNRRRLCPDLFWPIENPAPTLPRLRYESGCQCNTSQNPELNLHMQCRTFQLPVASLEPVGNSSTLRLVTRLMGVGCAALLSLPRSRRSPEPLTGSDLRRLNAMLGCGRSVYQPVSCSAIANQSQPAFVINADDDRVPRLLPDVRCPCDGQELVKLPLWVLKQKKDGSMVQEIASVGVSCAVCVT